jgi:hypothetical protein
MARLRMNTGIPRLLLARANNKKDASTEWHLINAHFRTFAAFLSQSS